MLSYPITGVREGTLQAERDGLYWNVSAVCSRDWNFPVWLSVLLYHVHDGKLRNTLKGLFRLEREQFRFR